MLGCSPVVDFDGTVARLPVDWAGLRDALGVSSVHELWADPADARWRLVDEAEVAAALVADPVAPVTAELRRCDVFAVLTANSERAVHAFLDGDPALAARCAIVVGRETLGGWKLHPARFRAGFARCVAATAGARRSRRVVYVGDDPRELRLAAAAGAVAIGVDDVRAAPGTASTVPVP